MALAAREIGKVQFPETERRVAELFAFAEETVKKGDATLSGLERGIEAQGREIMRTLLEEMVAKLPDAPGLAGIEGADGVKRLHERTFLRRLATKFGVIEYERKGFSAPEANNIMPKDESLNVPENRHSFELQLLVADEVAKGSFADARESIERQTGVTIGTQQLQQIAIRTAQDFDEFYHHQRSPEKVPPGDLVVLTADGKGVVTKMEDLRPATRKNAEQQTRKLSHRLSRGEKRNRKRMATVASVYTIAPFERTPADILHELRPVTPVKERPRPTEKRVWASVEKDQREVIEEACREVVRRDKFRKRELVVLVDGQEHQISLLEELLPAHRLSGVIVLDIIHVIEYVWKAGRCFFDESAPECEWWVTEQLERLLNSETNTVIRALRRKAAHAELEGKDLEVVQTTISYFKNLAPYMDYKRYLKQGYPIATGVIEGACRYLVKDRMDITGARWTLETAEAILKLRSLRASGDFDEYWGFYELKELERNHEGKIADTIPVNPQIRRIK